MDKDFIVLIIVTIMLSILIVGVIIIVLNRGSKSNKTSDWDFLGEISDSFSHYSDSSHSFDSCDCGDSGGGD